MTIKYGFFNSVDGDRKYNADDIGRYLYGLVSSGIYADETDSLQVLANGGMQIAVQPGRAMLDYHYMENDEPLVLELSAGGTLDRIDIVVARLDLSNRLCEIIVREGTPASAPARPIIYKTDLAKEYLLASIYVTKLASSITQSDITDTRADDTVCGWVRSIVGQGNAGIPVPAQSDAGKVPVVKSDGSGYTLQKANHLDKGGDTMGGILNMGGNRITLLGPPSAGTDAATADYVANQIKTNVTDKKGAANGIASLGSTGKVPSSQLPSLNYIPTSQKGAANGVASLDSTGKIPASQVPAASPATGTGTLSTTNGTITGDAKYYNVGGVCFVYISATLTKSNASNSMRISIDGLPTPYVKSVCVCSGANVDASYDGGTQTYIGNVEVINDKLSVDIVRPDRGSLSAGDHIMTIKFVYHAA